ncbi:hypothetical protein B0H11DRAFT_1818297 [Mycena galericulata]|nr:hypothetical protein B0H11DRAFT_1818297 [Mycena galericulata]
MDDMRPPKRRRSEEGESAETPIVRSEEYWFDDGNIILQVESTQFRLTKSMLAMHSSVFRDMFTVPLPADEPTIENCPVVVLPGDSSQDWTLLLGSIYPKSFTTDIPTMERIAAILRLSKKYDFPLFRKECLRRLKAEFPATLDVLDTLESWSLIKDDESSKMNFPLVSLAREIGLHSVLPMAFYLIIRNKDAMNQILNAEDIGMSANDCLACLRGYVKLLELQSSTTMAWLTEPHIPIKGCSQPDDCDAALNTIGYNLSTAHRPALYVFDDWHPGWGTDMCDCCQEKAKEVFEEGRAKCWERLPCVFGLADWEELKSLDFE